MPRPNDEVMELARELHMPPPVVAAGLKDPVDPRWVQACQRQGIDPATREPLPKPPPRLDALGRSLALLVVTGNLELTDAARALGKPDSALVHEAQAWAVAATEPLRDGALTPIAQAVESVALGLALVDGTTIAGVRSDVQAAGREGLNKLD